MITFDVDQAVVLEYQSEIQANGWLWRELKTAGRAQISHVFAFTRDDLIHEPPEGDEDHIDEFVFRFRFASPIPDYFVIAGRKLGLESDVLIAKDGIEWSRKLFAAERNISIFRRIKKLIEPGKDIVIGGTRDDAIPIDRFLEMLAAFPNSAELNRYASARVAHIVGDYLDPQRDFRALYTEYLSRRPSVQRRMPLRATELVDAEIQKFELIRDTVDQALKLGGRSEAEWQTLLLAFLPLIFPKYVAVIEKVRVEDHYTPSGKMTHREIDLALVDVNGNLDIIEIKQPFDDVLLRKTGYRGNFIPTRDLSGAIMQAEKYLFHLSKAGIGAEHRLTATYRAQLPPGLEIRITNPKAILILGRDCKRDGTAALDAQQLFDFEVIKRKYANMMDIITYDDLLRRLDRMIASLRHRRSVGLIAPAKR